MYVVSFFSREVNWVKVFGLRQVETPRCSLCCIVRSAVCTGSCAGVRLARMQRRGRPGTGVHQPHLTRPAGLPVRPLAPTASRTAATKSYIRKYNRAGAGSPPVH